MTKNETVVGWDGSEQSEEALDWAARRTQLQRGSLVIVNVTERFEIGHEHIPDDEPRREAVAAAHRITRDFPDLDVRSEVLDGRPVEVLAELSRTADLVVVGSPHGRAPFRLAAWTVGGGVSVTASSPVAVIPAGAGSSAAGDVVVGVDGSRLSIAAALFAAQEARASGSTLRVVHVWHEPDLWLDVVPWTDLSFDQMRVEHAALLDTVVGRVRAVFPGLSVVGTLRQGATARQLSLIEPPPRLIVIGSRARSRGAESILGSVAHELLVNQVSPVVVFPTVAAKKQSAILASASAG